MTIARASASSSEAEPLLQAVVTNQNSSYSSSMQQTRPGTTLPNGTSLPLAVAHRGYSAIAPENSMLAFQKAVEAGAHCIETDLHLSKDGVVVLAHDYSLKRTYGLEGKISDHDWAYLSTLSSIREPHEPMIRLIDLLEYLNEPSQEHMTLMLDIKRDDDAETLMRNAAAAIASVPCKNEQRGWSERMVLACWTATYIRLAQQYLPNFPLANVTWSPLYALAVTRKVPDISLSVQRFALCSPFGQVLMHRARQSGDHQVYSWTINEENWMDWAIDKQLSGVITDDPKLFLEVCERRRQETGLERARRRYTLQNAVRGVKSYTEILLFAWAYVVAQVVDWRKKGGNGKIVQKELGNE